MQTNALPQAAWSATDMAVALTAIAIATALLLPGIEHSRMAAEVTQCQENLRKLGEAFHAYEGSHRGFPGRRTGFGNGTTPYGGWGSLLLPHLDAELNKDFHHDYDFYDPINRKVTETSIKTFICPAAPPNRKTIVEANATGNSANPNKDTLFKAECGPNDYLASNGLFMPRTGYGLGWPREFNGNGHQAMTDNEDLPLTRISDGLSQTLLIIERAGAPQSWRMGKNLNKPDQFAMANNSRGAWAGWGSLNYGAFSPVDGNSPARGDASDCTVNCNNFFGIYGFHEAGANVLLCDGAVRLVGRKLDGLTLARLTTRDDGQLLASEAF